MEKLLNRSITARELIFGAALIACFMPWMTPPAALLLGFFIAVFIGHPFLALNHRVTHILLQFSVVGLGFGMDAGNVLKAGREGFLLTVASITGTLVFGLLLGRLLKIERKTSALITCGTAICGGSAIAAISPVIKAEGKQLSVALGTVFLLNSIALFLFPVIGRWVGLSQTQFGLWAAIAIHDTSSVVGAAGKYGPRALEVATAVKLARALWIVPISLLAGLFYRTGKQKVKIPYFIGAFVLAMLLNTYWHLPVVSETLVHASKIGLTLTLFGIGSGLSGQVLREMGIRPLLQGLLLWGLISGAALWAVMRISA